MEKEEGSWQRKKLSFIRHRPDLLQMAKSFCRRYKFTEYDVTKDWAALDEMVKVSGTEVPVIAACNEVMIGFEKTRLSRCSVVSNREVKCNKMRMKVRVKMPVS
jgi:hypothetical protein